VLQQLEAGHLSTLPGRLPLKYIIFDGRCEERFSYGVPDAYPKDAGSGAPKITDEGLKIIASPLDFVGINVYRPTSFAKAHPKMHSS
jgi:hypothetical protein